ncbi:hypothetical protein B0H13DRAFT_2308854 [Mycena leptocephala]|nr:hypothetical protein B0H13DRAFT_2308854 [Mycena leptocephala]
MFSILRAKGFGHSQALPDGRPPSPDNPIPHDSLVSNRAIPPACNPIGMGTQPPSPPPDPGSSSSSAKAPRWNRWIWVLLILVLLALVVVLGGYFIHFAYPDSPAAASISRVVAFARQILSAIERFFRDRWIAAGSWISGVKIYISQNGRQISKILLVALASHFVCLLVFGVLRLFCACAMSLPTCCHVIIWSFLISMAVIAFVPQLNWIMWMFYYFGYLNGELSSVQKVICIVLQFSSSFLSLAASNFVELSMIFGIILMHASAMGLRALFFLVFVAPSTEWALLEEVLNMGPLDLFLLGPCLLAWSCVATPMPLLIAQYARLDSNGKQLLWRSLFCQKSRDTVRATFRRFFEQLDSWKSIQIHDFHELTSGLPNTLTMIKASLETWRTLPLIQRFLIIAPAVIFYSYLYIVPTARRLRLRVCIRNWLGRWTHTLEGEHAEDHEDRRGRPTLFKDKRKAAYRHQPALSPPPDTIECLPADAADLAWAVELVMSPPAFRPPSRRLYPQLHTLCLLAPN